MKNITIKTSLSKYDEQKPPDKKGVKPKKLYRETGPLKRLVEVTLMGEHFFYGKIIEGKGLGGKLTIWYKNVDKDWISE